MSIEIPARLGDCLGSDRKLAAHVGDAVEAFSPWFELSGLPFFPDFTDHGPTHVSMVLRAAEGLITDDAWKVFSAADAAILVLATLLHDCALHFREQTFLFLIAADGNDTTGALGDRPWPELWREFLAEARRFDAKRLHKIFGDAAPVVPPGEDFGSWTRRDRLLIGEFLRRHHPRIAHEVATHGVPTKDAQRLRLPEQLRELSDLAGLVARSHGGPLRSTLPYLNERFGGTREYKGCHAIFVMAVLRISDYLQLQASRAPNQLLKVAAIRSPISKGEWRAHESVLDISHVGDDPEAVTILAKPEDVRAFLRVRDWLADIQNELDSSWAVLGEVYGRVHPLNTLGISLRRVRSNLDDIQIFGRSVSYVPLEAAFSTADASLLKLLAVPLYGDQPAVGIRELLQNAVDAVRERTVVTAGTSPGGAPSADGTVDVSVKMTTDKNGSWWFELDDRGIGMTAATVNEYFLRAGASYRYSDAWRRTFEDSEGHSSVLRSGRFGIGAIAGFLIGDELEVVTRHLNAPADDGIAFHAALDDDVVELRRVECEVGTTIRIKLRQKTAEALFLPKAGAARNGDLDTHLTASWDWYCLASPKVERTVRTLKLKQQISTAAAGDVLPAGWQRIVDPDYQDLHWSFTPGLPPLIVNGIRVATTAAEAIQTEEFGAETKQILRASEGVFGFRQPTLSVFDPDGKLPLNLQRTGLALSEYPFQELLKRSIAMQFVAEVAVHGPASLPQSQDEWLALAKWDATGIHFNDLYGGHRVTWGLLFATADGFGVTDAQVIAAAPQVTRIVLTPYRGFRPYQFSPAAVCLSPGTAVIPVWLDYGTQGLYRLIRRCLYPVFDGTERRGAPFSHRRIRGARVVLSASLAKAARGSLRRVVIGAISEKIIAPGWVSWSIGDLSDLQFNLAEIHGHLEKPSGVPDSEEPEIIGELSLEPPGEQNNIGVVGQFLMKAFGGPIIPYDVNARITAVRSSDSEFDRYMQAAKGRTIPRRIWPYRDTLSDAAKEIPVDKEEP